MRIRVRSHSLSLSRFAWLLFLTEKEINMASQKFILEVHYKGYFVELPQRMYFGGEVFLVHHVHPDTVSLFEMQYIVEDLGEPSCSTIYHRMPDMDMDAGLREVSSDEDVINMFAIHTGRHTIPVHVVAPAWHVIQPLAAEPGPLYVEDRVVENIDEGAIPAGLVEEEDDDEYDGYSDAEESSEPSKIGDENESSDSEWEAEKRGKCDENPTDRTPASESPSHPQGETSMPPTDGTPASVSPSHPQGKTSMLDDSDVEESIYAPSDELFSVHGSSSDDDVPHYPEFQPTHNCGRSYENRQATLTWLSNKYLERLRDDPNWKSSAMQNSVRREWMVDVSLSQVYRAKRKAKEAIVGSYRKQYVKLRSYCEEILRTNPGSVTLLKVERRHMNGAPTFQRLFVVFDAQKRGFLDGVRPFICLDACHLKGEYGGQLLCAVGRDGNDRMYPLAIAAAEAECKDSWCWFLENLKSVLGSTQDRGWTFISDSQKITDSV